MDGLHNPSLTRLTTSASHDKSKVVLLDLWHSSLTLRFFCFFLTKAKRRNGHHRGGMEVMCWFFGTITGKAFQNDFWFCSFLELSVKYEIIYRENLWTLGESFFSTGVNLTSIKYQDWKLLLKAFFELWWSNGDWRVWTLCCVNKILIVWWHASSR